MKERERWVEVEVEMLRTSRRWREGGREVFSPVVLQEAGDIMGLFLKTSHMAFPSGTHAYSAWISLHSPDLPNNPDTDSPMTSRDLGLGSEAGTSAGSRCESFRHFKTPSCVPTSGVVFPSTASFQRHIFTLLRTLSF